MNHPTEDDIEQLLSGRSAAGAPEFADVVSVLRSGFGSHEIPAVGAALKEFVDPALLAEWQQTPVSTTVATAAPMRREPAIGRTRKKLATVGTFVGTFTGKILLGAALAAAAAGGAQALGVINLPGFDHHRPAPSDVVVPTTSTVPVDTVPATTVGTTIRPTKTDPTGPVDPTAVTSVSVIVPDRHDNVPVPSVQTTPGHDPSAPTPGTEPAEGGDGSGTNSGDGSSGADVGTPPAETGAGGGAGGAISPGTPESSAGTDERPTTAPSPSAGPDVSTTTTSTIAESGD